MNKAIIFGLLFCLVLSSFGLAGPGTPQLVYGFIQQNDYPVKNLAIRVTNTDTEAFAVSSTNENGFFQVDLLNFDDSYRGGDVVKVALIYCESSPKCSKSVEIS